MIRKNRETMGIRTLVTLVLFGFALAEVKLGEAELQALDKFRTELEKDVAAWVVNYRKQIKTITENVEEKMSGKMEEVREEYVKILAEKKLSVDLTEKLEKVKEMKEKWEKFENFPAEVEKMGEEFMTSMSDDDEFKNLKGELGTIERQAQLQQFNEEEKTRSDGNSGIKQLKSVYTGEKNYHARSHTGQAFAGIHDLPQYKDHIGIDQFEAVLNGFEFRTIKNEFKLQSQHSTDPQLGAVEDIPSPPVPHSVTGTVDEQVDEMAKYFEAFHKQDKNIRSDYEDYFWPVMVYLEGTWIKADSKVEQPFDSDLGRQLEGLNWDEIHEKAQRAAYTGRVDETIAQLPTTIMDFEKDAEGKIVGGPIYGQWIYKIKAHRIQKKLPTAYFKPLYDLTSMRISGLKKDQYLQSKAARFTLNHLNVNAREQRFNTYTYLDIIMDEIYGMGNTKGTKFTATGFDSTIISGNPKINSKTPLNAAFYHRSYKLASNDAMGVNSAVRGYSDFYYQARTNNSNVVGPSYTEKNKEKDTKELKSTKVVYALPLEVVYLTPLPNWNPHRVIVKEGQFYQTPAALFPGEEFIRAEGRNGEFEVAASGIRTTATVNEVQGRYRFPIFPIYGEGGATWKKLNAMADTVEFDAIPSRPLDYYAMGVSQNDEVKRHSHTMEVGVEKLKMLKNGLISSLEITTDSGASHTHHLTIIYDKETDSLKIGKCGEHGANEDDTFCHDHHGATLSTSEVAVEE